MRQKAMVLEMPPEKETLKEKKPANGAADKTVMDLSGVGAATADKLALAGFDDLMAVAVSTPGELIAAAGLTEAVARKMIQEARGHLKMGFMSGADILAKRAKVLRISTGSKNFDGGSGCGSTSWAFVCSVRQHATFVSRQAASLTPRPLSSARVCKRPPSNITAAAPCGGSL